MNMYYVDPIIKSFLRTYQPEGRAPYVRLDQNENPDGLPQWVYDEAMAKINPSYLSMYPEEIVFREKYASVLGINPDQLTLTDGSVVGMGYIIKVFGESGKKMLCVTPTFGMYKVYGDMVGMETMSIKYNSDFTFDVGNILKNINNETGIVVLVNPNMPIGNSYSKDEILSVLKKAQSSNAIVIIDEAYLYFNDESAIDLIDKYDNVIILRTFSKMLSMPGLRLGVIISNKEFIQYINNYKPHYTINCVAIAFAETIIDHYDKVLDELKGVFNEGKHYLLSKLDEAGYSYLPTKGCFICIYPKYKTAEEITEKLKNNGILIFCGKGDSAGFLRVTIWNKKYMELFVEKLLKIDVK